MVSTMNRNVAALADQKPKPAPKKVERRTPVCYAHRGARAYAPENTLLAFAVALDLGADAIECDVQRTRDGGLIIFHDGIVDRTTDGAGPVGDMSLAELRSLDAGRYRRTPQRIPTLDETLTFVRERGAGMNLEIKGESAGEAQETARACLPTLRALDDASRTRVLVSSFDHPALAVLRRELPSLRIGLLYGKEWRGRDLVSPARKLGAEAIHPDRRIVTPKLIRRAHDAGLRVNVWTANKPATIRRLIAWGVDGIFSDYPDRVVIARALAENALGGPGAAPQR